MRYQSRSIFASRGGKRVLFFCTSSSCDDSGVARARVPSPTLRRSLRLGSRGRRAELGGVSVVQLEERVARCHVDTRVGRQAQQQGRHRAADERRREVHRPSPSGRRWRAAPDEGDLHQLRNKKRPAALPRAQNPKAQNQAALRSTIIFLICAMALAGFSPLGQAFAQFMIVWQR